MADGRSTRWIVAALAAATALAAAVAVGREPRIEMPTTLPESAASNIERRDYVGPQVCAECHPKKANGWQKHLHSSMNARPGPAAVIGPFKGEIVRYGGGTARFSRDGDRFVVDLRSSAGVKRRFEVTRTIGSHFQQELVGRQLSGPEATEHEIYRREVRLPFGYWKKKERWFHQQYYDSWFGPEYQGNELAIDPYEPDLESWEPRCPWCHNTYAFDLRLFRSDAAGIGNGIERYFKLASPDTDTERYRSAARGQLPLDELVTVGISCESCHLGGREHAENEEEIAFGPRNPRLEDGPGHNYSKWGRESPAVRTALCSQCHSAPSPRYPDGSSRRNSSEALDLAASKCSPSITCTDCHDPHIRGSKADRSKQRAACLGCHPRFKDQSAALSHARHATGEADCLDCHMPRTVQGFSSMIRTHRVSRAFEPSMVAAGQPNACNLCHLDRSVRWAAEAVSVYWGQRVSAPDDERPAGEVWLSSDDPHLMVTAAAAYARSPLGRKVLPSLAKRLDHPIAYYRMRMLFAIEEILGRPLRSDEYEPVGPPAARARAARRLRLEEHAKSVEKSDHDEGGDP